jgi:hypothetical protein
MLANWLASCGYSDGLDLAPEFAAEVEARRLAAFAQRRPAPRAAAGPAVARPAVAP